jgi:hypothetical protein
MKIILNEEAQWPKDINLIEIQPLEKVLDVFDELKHNMSIPIDSDATLSTENLIPTMENLTATPQCFIPTLSFILRKIENLCTECNDKYKMPRRFALLPFSSLRWKYVSINDRALSSNTKQKLGSSYEDKIKLFYNVFDFRKFGFER